jgi:hypothetical protein
MEKPKIYHIGVYLPMSLCVEVVATNKRDAIESAKAEALETPFEDWNDDFSRATAEVLDVYDEDEEDE